ncbi:hypothetical protein ACEN2H_15475, partial [Flavobacterium sp. W22_SRS_FP1]
MKNLLFTLIILFSLTATAQSVGINSDGSTPDPSAILDLKSTTKGFLPPRMTEDQRVLIAAVEGLIVFQTDKNNGLYLFKNADWIKLTMLPDNTIAQNGQVLMVSNGQLEWATPLIATPAEVGPQGVQGDKGDQGLTGAQGDKGDQGIQGLVGATGAQGDKGDQGIQGIQGLAGATGAQGDKGDQGIQGLTGAASTIAGPQGVQGATGALGDKGDQGIQGLVGATGAQGDKGDQGIQGLTGAASTIA